MGSGGTLTGFYSSGKLCMMPAGGFLAGRLKNEGMEKGDFDVQLWPCLAQPEASVRRWRSLAVNRIVGRLTKLGSS